MGAQFETNSELIKYKRKKNPNRLLDDQQHTKKTPSTLEIKESN